MLKRRRFFAAFVVAGLCFSSVESVFENRSFQVPSAYASGQTDQKKSEAAKKFVARVAKNGIGFLGNSEMTEARRATNFRELLQNSFDMKTIARFALGRYWRSATDKQKKEYLSLFQDMIVEVYSRRFSDYNGQEVTVTKARGTGKSDVMVTSFIVSEDSPDIQVDWRVREKKGSYKIVDIIVEGVSMSLTQRSDFSSVIQRGGGKISVLLEHLRK